jgi:hypothetical protein
LAVVVLVLLSCLLEAKETSLFFLVLHQLAGVLAVLEVLMAVLAVLEAGPVLEAQSDREPQGKEMRVVSEIRMERLTALEEEAAALVLLDLMEVVQAEETEALVHLLALLEHLRLMQAAAAGLVIQEVQEQGVQEGLVVEETEDSAVPHSRGNQIRAGVLAAMDIQVEAVQMEVLVL